MAIRAASPRHLAMRSDGESMVLSLIPLEDHSLNVTRPHYGPVACEGSDLGICTSMHGIETISFNCEGSIDVDAVGAPGVLGPCVHLGGRCWCGATGHIEVRKGLAIKPGYYLRKCGLIIVLIARLRRG